ncbi:hypothetical protein F3Y22_tig00111000pilonHSYRG00125 [Hibiscus syriacus]|uniref:Uncharacterized protein n=1 Tax=Hibiscus syriacus TaxID=106335 RepID=A0A6A2Z8T4_HIBSY|nr:hypothetical protein F3Y22_tig00111000pilonHSYRG00125 [Hibiscus syriacus]
MTEFNTPTPEDAYDLCGSNHESNNEVDIAGPELNAYMIEDDQPPTASTKMLYNRLGASSEPIWVGSNQSKLSVVSELIHLKAQYRIPKACYDDLCRIMQKLMPENNVMPKNIYETKKLVRDMGLSVQKIHCCRNGCMIYWGSDFELSECKFCDHPRYKDNVEVYAKHMRWHAEHQNDETSLMCHPSDSLAWKHFNQEHLTFSYETHNVRLRLCTDGFQPFGQSGQQYSLWPVIVTPYNLPPPMFMNDEFMFFENNCPSLRRDKQDWLAIVKVKARAIMDIPISNNVEPGSTSDLFQDDESESHPIQIKTNDETELLIDDSATQLNIMDVQVEDDSDEDENQNELYHGLEVEDFVQLLYTHPLSAPTHQLMLDHRILMILIRIQFQRPFRRQFRPLLMMALVRGQFIPFLIGKYEFQKHSYYRNPGGVAIKQNFHPHGFNWKAVPEETKHIYFDEFKVAGVLYAEALHHWRSNIKTRPQYMSEETWQSYLDHWNSLEFKKRSDQAKKNRHRGDIEAKPLGSHTGGSISAIEWKERLEHRTGETEGAFPFYKFTHTSKDNKDDGWFNDNHREFANKYLQTLVAAQEATSANELSSVSVDPYKIFLEVAGGVSSKGRVFGVGSAAPIYYNTSQTSSSSKRFIPRNPEQQEEIDTLKEQLRQVQEHQDMLMNLAQQQGYSQMFFEANYNGQSGFYPSMHRPLIYPGFSAIQPLMRLTFRGSTSTSMPLHPQTRGCTPLTPFF